MRPLQAALEPSDRCFAHLSYQSQPLLRPPEQAPGSAALGRIYVAFRHDCGFPLLILPNHTYDAYVHSRAVAAQGLLGVG